MICIDSNIAIYSVNFRAIRPRRAQANEVASCLDVR
jgi:hypothetical protein